MVQPDDGLTPFLREIDGAACSVDLSVYLLSEPQIIEHLGQAAERGVRVRVMLEEYPFGGGGGQVETRATLEALRIEVRWSGTRLRFSHAKYMVVDSAVAVVMNQNLTTSAFTSNREFAVITTERAEVEQAQEVFDRDWEHLDIDDPDGPLILSPTNSRERLVALVAGAERSIDLYAEVIRDDEIVTALGEAAGRGVAVRLIVDQSIDDGTQEHAIRLFEMGVEIRIASSLYIHAKLMVIDGEVAVVGSQNPTPTSLDDNREVSMVVDDEAVLERCARIFERDWQRASPGAPT
jgi:phosphatidylserine/phosphatidylglycerophosphate/cardiolipin synthase-like enzyme